MRALRQIIRGCGDLPHVGPHPGTGLLLALLFAGALAGVKGGWVGAIGGISLMGVFMVPIYLWGAYDRASYSDALQHKSPSQEADDSQKARRPLICCAAARDGDCTHPDCPQLRDNEPKASGRHCPLDNHDEDD